MHMYWSCLSLSQFWADVFHTLSRFFRIEETLNPLLALFGISGEELPLLACKRQALSFFSLLARRTILIRWKGAAPPTHKEWLYDLMSCLRLEKIRCSLQHSTGKFNKIWGPSDEYIFIKMCSLFLPGMKL